MIGTIFFFYVVDVLFSLTESHKISILSDFKYAIICNNSLIYSARNNLNFIALLYILYFSTSCSYFALLFSLRTKSSNSKTS